MKKTREKKTKEKAKKNNIRRSVSGALFRHEV
jgi:hypothetical protein